MALITVIDVMHMINVEPNSELCWRVGALTREAWVKEKGELPPKILRPKTNGSGGTHCFAGYPMNWKKRIARIIQAHEVETKKQYEMF